MQISFESFTKRYFKVSRRALVVSMVFFFMSVPGGRCAAAVKRPLVAIAQIISPEKDYSYVGPAVTQMLETRLSSEGIDTFLVKDSGPDAVGLADFLITGLVKKTENTFDAEIVLKDPEKGEMLKSWHLKAVNLDVLAQDTSLLSVKLAETIKHAEDILKPPNLEQMPESRQRDDVSDEFQMARLHPDKLVREQLVQDEEKEKELERQKTGEKIRRTEQLRKQESKKEEADWFPLPDVYDKDTDEPVEEPARLEGSDNASLNDSVPEEEPLGIQHTVGEEKNKSWLSSLWPFGSKDDSRESWEKEREKLKSEKEEREKKARVVPENGLPYPPPPEVKFDIPEPVPLDQAISQAEKIYVEKPATRQKKEGWFSWLWPFGNEEKAAVMPEKKAYNQNLQTKVHGSIKVQQEMDGMIQNISGVKNQTQADGAEEGSVYRENETGEQLRQEHVYFGPRINPENQEKQQPFPEDNNDAGSEDESSYGQELQAKVQNSAFPVESNTQVEPSMPPENVPGQQPIDSNLSGSEGETALKNRAKESQAPPLDETDTNIFRNGHKEPERAGGEGPIWRWY